MQNILLAVLFSVFNIDGLLLRHIPFRGVVRASERRRMILVHTASLVVNGLVMYGVFIRCGISLAVTKADYFLFPLLSAILNILLIPGRTREHLFVYGIVATCNFMLSSFPMYLVTTVLGLSGPDSIFVLVLLQMALQWVCYPFTKRLLKKTVEPFLFLDSGNYWATIWFIPIAMLLAVMVLFPGNVHVSSLNHLLSRALIGIATVLMCYSIAADHRILRDQRTMTEQLMDQRLHYAQLQTKVEDARKKGHDFKHHIAAIRRFAEHDDKEGLLRYCDALYAQTAAETQSPYTGNPAADGVVYRYMQLSQEHGIRFEYDGVIRSDGIEDVDICVLLGNALDNALAGCMSVEQNRWIQVAARAEGQVLSLLVANSFDGVILWEGDTILSRKRDHRPGVGLASMRSVCDRCGGQLETNWDDDTFTILFLLPLKDN